jgi:D-amino-acid oxidase
MLDELRNDDKAVNVDVETGQYYSSMDEMVDDAVQMECDGLLNCTGLGSASICKDEALVGARGVLLQYDRATAKRTMQVHAVTDDELVNDAVILIEDAPLGSETMPCYLIPRGNLLVVGGTYLEGDPATEIRPKERERLLLNAKALGIDSDSTPHIGEWVGFRPYRPTTRCELDTSFDKLRVVHNYGHGGSGWTVYIGAAAEGVRLMTGG